MSCFVDKYKIHGQKKNVRMTHQLMSLFTKASFLSGISVMVCRGGTAGGNGIPSCWVTCVSPLPLNSNIKVGGKSASSSSSSYKKTKKNKNKDLVNGYHQRVTLPLTGREQARVPKSVAVYYLREIWCFIRGARQGQDFFFSFHIYRQLKQSKSEEK